MGLGVREGKFVSILGFSRLAMGMTVTLAQSSKGVNPLGTEAAEITGSGRGNKGCRKCGDIIGPTERWGRW